MNRNFALQVIVNGQENCNEHASGNMKTLAIKIQKKTLKTKDKLFIKRKIKENSMHPVC